MNLDRYYGPALRPSPLSKPVKLISEDHLRWIRQQPCVATGREHYQVDAHHHQKKSQIRNDYTAIPLLHEIHIGELHGKSDMFVEDKYRIDLKDALIAKLVERCWLLETELKEARRGQKK